MTDEKKTGGGGPEVVFALYRPKPGQDEALRRLIADHLPVLRRLELVTDRPALLVRAKDGTYVEVFEWRTSESADLAHQHPDVAKVWEAMGAVCEFASLDSLEEAKQAFCHFEPVSP